VVREPPDPTPVRSDAAADLGAAGADRLTDVVARARWAKRGRNTGEVSEKMEMVVQAAIPRRGGGVS
jgi:hypothetical protein